MRCKSRNGSSKMIPNFKDNFGEQRIYFSKKKTHNSKRKDNFRITSEKTTQVFGQRVVFFFLCFGLRSEMPRTSPNFSEIHPQFLCNTSSISLQYILNFSEIHPQFLRNTSSISPKFLLYFSAISPLFLCKTSPLFPQQISPFPPQKPPLRAKNSRFFKNLARKCNHLPRNE